MIDLRPYVNEAALVTTQNSSLRRVVHLFRSLGLRHLLVVESCPTVVGVITRKDVLMGGEEFLLRDVECDTTNTFTYPLRPNPRHPSPDGCLSNGVERRTPFDGPILENSPTSPFTTLWRSGLAALGVRYGGCTGSNVTEHLRAPANVAGQLDAPSTMPPNASASAVDSIGITPLRAAFRVPRNEENSPDAGSV